MASSTRSLIVSFTYLIGGLANTIRFASVLSTKCNFATPSSPQDLADAKWRQIDTKMTSK